MNMKRWIKTFVIIALAICCGNSMMAQVISFSMEEEKSVKNTPDGWAEVNLPKDLPTFTEANTFYITDFGASPTAADNTEAIQKALDAANSAHMDVRTYHRWFKNGIAPLCRGYIETTCL